MSTELKLITPRRNFLIRALGFTAAGATLPIGLVAADDPAARIAHHQVELEKAWRDYYGPGAVRTYAACGRRARPIRPITTAGRNFLPCRRSCWLRQTVKARRGLSTPTLTSANCQAPDPTVRRPRLLQDQHGICHIGEVAIGDLVNWGSCERPSAAVRLRPIRSNNRVVRKT
jgi:hypothetical protein